MPRTRPPYVLRCACGYTTLRVRGHPPRECPKCGGALAAHRIPRDVARALKKAA